MKCLNILGIVGSVQKSSYNRSAHKGAQELVPDGVVLTLIELQDIPIFDQDSETNPPASVMKCKRQILAANAILFATPEYNYSVPSVLKNTIDWASRPHSDNAWVGKPAAIMGVSEGGSGTARAKYHLRQILVALNMPVVNKPEVMIGNAEQRVGLDGRLTDETTRQLIRKVLVALVQLATISRGHGTTV